MKFRATINLRTGRKANVTNATNKMSGSKMISQMTNHICADCRIGLVKQNMEFVCPNCGMVEELIDGSE
ncbi:MAG TPA: hypothetical protein VJJ76_00305 [archaeon]|nr:hypothetical protein [archaeon]